jgi:hypothetical protein
MKDHANQSLTPSVRAIYFSIFLSLREPALKLFPSGKKAEVRLTWGYADLLKGLS